MNASLKYLIIAVSGALAACGSKGDREVSVTDGSGASGGSGGGANDGGGGVSTGSGGSGGGHGGGTGGSAGAPPEAMLIYGFDSGLEQWKFVNSNSDAAKGVAPVPEEDITLEWSEDEGDPGGALLATIGYFDTDQWVSFGIDLTQKPVDLSQRTLSADVKILSGVGEAEDLMNAPAGAKIYAKSGSSYVYANGKYHNIETIGDWYHLTFDVDEPLFVDEANGTFDPSEVREIGIQFDSNSESTTAQEGVWVVDNISY